MTASKDDEKCGNPSGSVSYIDSLFFADLPSTAQSVPKLELEQNPLDFNVEEDGSYIDQTYFRQPRDLESLSPRPPFGPESAADVVTELREQFNINQYAGGTLDFKGAKKRPVRAKKDSQGFRIPDDDPIKFHVLTEDEAALVLFKSIIAVQDNVLVLNKPPGISSHGGKGQYFSVDSLLPRLALKLRQHSQAEPEKFQLTHRLDKEATGTLLVSRNHDTHLKLTEAFANRWIKKSYLCITSGIPKEREGSIYLPISERLVGGVYRMVAHMPKTHESADADILNDEEEEQEALQKKTNAVTHYRVLERRHDAALVECTTVTGLKHQIRVHLSAALETPILGDHKYSHFGHLAPQRLAKRTLDALEIRQSKVRYMGLHLHAHRLVFRGAEASESVDFGQFPTKPPPPPGFFSFIQRRGGSFREARNFTAPVPSFFLANVKRLGMHMPSVLKWSRFKMF